MKLTRTKTMILLALAACSATAQTGRSAYEFLDVPTLSLIHI